MEKFSPTNKTLLKSVTVLKVYSRGNKTHFDLYTGVVCLQSASGQVARKELFGVMYVPLTDKKKQLHQEF